VGDPHRSWYSLYLLYWHKSTGTDEILTDPVSGFGLPKDRLYATYCEGNVDKVLKLLALLY
jgi:hypothetical protein